MSLYRFVRLTAVLAVLRRYRARLVRLLFLLCFALVTAWQYADIAVYMQQHHPEWSGAALIIKTLIVYTALFWGFWEIGRMLHGDDGQQKAPVGGAGAPSANSASAKPPEPGSKLGSQPVSALEQLAEKPKLRSRKSDILDAAAKPPQR